MLEFSFKQLISSCTKKHVLENEVTLYGKLSNGVYVDIEDNQKQYMYCHKILDKSNTFLLPITAYGK